MIIAVERKGEPMRLIDADKIVYSWQIDGDGQEHDGVTLESIINKMPTIESEQCMGEWEEIEVISEAYDIVGVKTWASKMRCNQCGFTTFAIEGHFAQYNFCPSCGADMRGEQDGNQS